MYLSLKKHIDIVFVLKMSSEDGSDAVTNAVGELFSHR